MGTLDSGWSQVLAERCRALHELTDTDPGAHISLHQEGELLILDAYLSDGRATRRWLSKPEGLGIALEALLELPPHAAVSAPALPERTPLARHPVTAAAPEPALAQRSSSLPSREVGLAPELGLGVEQRVAGSPMYLFNGATGYAAARFDRVLFGFAVRWDFVQWLRPPGFADFDYAAVAIGFVLVRRFSTNANFSVDWGGQAFIAGESQSTTLSGSRDADSTADVKLGGLFRVNTPPAPVRWAITLDLDFSPLRLARPLRIDPELPRLPSVTAGIGIGASWTP